MIKNRILYIFSHSLTGKQPYFAPALIWSSFFIVFFFLPSCMIWYFSFVLPDTYIRIMARTLVFRCGHLFQAWTFLLQLSLVQLIRPHWASRKSCLMFPGVELVTGSLGTGAAMSNGLVEGSIWQCRLADYDTLYAAWSMLPQCCILYTTRVGCSICSYWYDFLVGPWIGVLGCPTLRFSEGSPLGIVNGSSLVLFIGILLGPSVDYFNSVLFCCDLPC